MSLHPPAVRPPARTGPKPGDKRAPRVSNSNVGFACPKCDERTNVKDSRQDIDGGIRRRRECPVCQWKFTTTETANVALKPSEREQFKLLKRLIPKLCALADDIDLLQAEHE